MITLPPHKQAFTSPNEAENFYSTPLPYQEGEQKSQMEYIQQEQRDRTLATDFFLAKREDKGMKYCCDQVDLLLQLV